MTNLAYNLDTSFSHLPEPPLRDFEFFPGELEVCRKKEPMDCADWAERFREIRVSSVPGLWRHTNAPYFEEPMRWISLPWVREIRICAGSQLGKTEFQYNALGFITDYDPGPALCVMPSKDTVQRASLDRIQPMFEDCEPLRRLKSRNPDDTATTRIKLRNGTFIYFGWAGSDAILASNPIRLLIIDEADLVGRRSINLARARFRTYRLEYKMLEVSKPSIEDGPIWEDLGSSHVIYDYHIPCPLCGHEQVMHFGQFRWTEGVTDPRRIEMTGDAWYECEACTKRWDETLRDQAVRAGRWRPRRFCATCHDQQLRDGTCPRCGNDEPAPLPEYPETLGAHLPAFNSRFVRFSDVVADYLRYQQDPFAKEGDAPSNAEKFWCDDCALPMPTGIEGETLDEQALYDRREDYAPPGAEWEIPMTASLVTAFVDVQGNRLEILVEAWGQKKENWGVIHEVIPGSPSLAATWKELEDKYLDKVYLHESGVGLRITALGIDSGGHHTDEVYKFVKKWRRRRKVYATKGWQQPGKPIKGKPSLNNAQKVPLYMIGTEAAKDTMAGWLSSTEPGPYYQHFPRTFGFEFFRQLCAEEPHWKKDAQGRPVKVWRIRKGYKRNEGLDLKVGNLAVYEILNPSMEALARNIRLQMLEMMLPKIEEGADETPVEQQEGPPLARKRKKTVRKKRSGFASKLKG
jgi:phage terminase large subunit GpA-like protein